MVFGKSQNLAFYSQFSIVQDKQTILLQYRYVKVPLCLESVHKAGLGGMGMCRRRPARALFLDALSCTESAGAGRPHYGGCLHEAGCREDYSPSPQG